MAKGVGHPKMGRPTTYNDKLIDTFLDRIMDGRGLDSVLICQEKAQYING